MAVFAFGQSAQNGPPSTGAGGAITINDNANGSPYPSTVIVTNYAGRISRVTVTLNGVTHGYPDDIDVVLVGPTSEKVTLISDAGGQFDIGSVDLTFDSTAAASAVLPDEAPITTGRYRPTNYNPAGDVDPAIAAGAGTDLGVFIGDDSTGVWSLYVNDDTEVDAGTIRSWTLRVFTEPVVTVSTNRVVTNEDTTGSLTVSVNDSDTPEGSLNFTAFIPNSSTNLIQSVTVSGTGTNRTYTVTPRANQTGTGTFEVRVADEVDTYSTVVNVQVDPVNDAPTIALNTSTTQVAQGGISTNILATLSDIDNDVTTLEVLSISSSNPAVVSTNNVFVVGSGTNNSVRHVRITPTANAASGAATITLRVRDSAGAGNNVTIDVTVTPVAHVVAGNPAAITIPTSGTATPYPSTVTVQNVSGLVGKLTVTLLDLNHAEPDDIGILLVGPEGQQVVLMRGAGGTAAVTDQRLVFDEAAGNIPAGAMTTSTNGTADYTGGNFPGPAPAGPYEVSLDDFIGTNPNGTWSLYVYDAQANTAGGSINAGWALNIFPAPVVGAIGPRTTQEDTPIDVTFSVSDQDGTVTNIIGQIFLTASNPNQIVNLSSNLSGTTGTIRITPLPNASGTNIIRVIAQDNNGFTGTNLFSIIVTPVNDLPTQSVIPKQLARAGQSVGPISFTVGDVETAAGSLIVTATSNNPKLLPPGSIILGGSGATRTITIFPSGAQGGQADITVTVTDAQGGSSSQTFDLTVEEAAFPLFEQSTSIQVNDNANATPYPSVITVSGLSSPIAEVQVTLFGITHPSPDDLDIILVHPDGTRSLVFMSDAGGGVDKPLNNVTLIFRDSAAAPLGDEDQIVTGTFRPSNYGTGDFTGSPTESTETTFAGAFNGRAANGDWRLYVRDDTAGPRGGLITSWQLGIRTLPQIADIPTQTTQEDTQLRFTVDIGDAQPGVPYTITTSVTGTPDVVDTITTERSDDDLIVTIVPEDDASGTNRITITVQGPDGPADSSEFDFVVTPRNDAPRFSDIPNTSTPAATPVTISFNVVDVEGSAVTVTASSSDQAVVSDSGITVSPSGGTTQARTISIVPNGITSGTTTITLTGSDGTSTSTETFVLTVTRNVSFANNRAITISDFAPATPYPSTIDVSGVQGTVSDVSVTLVGFRHQFPDDVDVLLVAPDNRRVMLMSDAGGGTAVENLRLTFSADAGLSVPDSGTLTSRSYVPENWTDAAEGNETQLPSPAPAGPYGDDLTSLDGVNPNGQWRLFVRDDTFQLAGEITGGWILVIETGPTISPIAGPITTPEDVPAEIRFNIGDQDTAANDLDVEVSVTGNSVPNLVVSTNLILSGTNENRVLTVIPTTNLFGTNLITLTVTDENGTEASTSFAFRVNAVDDPPVFLGFENATNRYVLNEDSTRTFSFSIGDIDSTVGTTNITVATSNPTLLTNIVVGGEVNDAGDDVAVETITVTPNADQNGTATLTISLRDQTSTVTTNIIIDVTPVNDAPTIAASTNQVFVQAGATSGVVNVRITDIETSARNLTLTANSLNPSIIPNSNILLGGSDTNRTVQFIAVSTPGVATVNLIVSDGTTSTTLPITVEVTPAPGSVFANPAAITIRDNNTAQPYPSTIPVSGMRGPISRVSVTLDGLTHTAPDDVDVLLVHRDSGRKVLLLSDVGGRNPVTNVRLTFDARSGNRNLADESPIVSGTYLPTDYQSGDTFPAGTPNPPTGPYSTDLTAFNGITANTLWDLYVIDDTAADSGQIAFGWSLRIETAPTIVLDNTSPTTVTVSEDTPVIVDFNIDDMTTTNGLVLSYSNSNPALIASIVQTPNPISGSDVSIRITPTANAVGTNVLTITVRRPDNDASLPDAQSSITVTQIWTPVADLPTMSRVINQTTQEDTPVSFEVLINDVDTPLANLWLVAESDDPAVITTNRILLNGTTNVLKGLPDNVVRVTLNPNPGAVGDSTISLTLSENGASNAVTSNFVFTVTERNDRPIIVNTNSDPVGIAAGESRQIQIFAADPEGLAVTLTATSSDQTLVRDADIVISPVTSTTTNRAVTITTQAGVTGRATITLTAADPANNRTTATFSVEVRPTRERVFSNTGRITINDNAAASPYPSVITVSNLVGNVSKVTVTINRLYHTFPDDVDMLLVSPTGQSVLIWSDMGGGDPDPTNVVIKLDDAALNPLPNSGPLVSGTFRPTNDDTTSDLFPAPAPGTPTPTTPYADSLATFNGRNPNGQWRLFIIDDTASDAGFIADGWSLGITTQPVLVGLNNVTSQEDVPARLSFTIAEESFAGTDFTFSVASSNPAVVPSSTNNIVVSGTGTNRTVNVIPAPNASGASTITLTLRNSDGQEVPGSFVATFTPVNDVPVVTQVPNQAIPAGSFVTVTNFNISDVETETKDLVVAVTSSNPSVIAPEDVVIVGNEILIESQGDVTGSTVISIRVTDADGASTTMSFTVTVTGSTNPVFVNTEGITIRDNTTALPYPSIINVSNVSGTISKVTVTLRDVRHSYPDDVDILLVGPNGQSVVLMSDAGAGGTNTPAQLVNGRLTFDDAAAAGVPDNSEIPEVGTFRPSNYEGSETFPAPAPGTPYGTALSVFAGTNPNGTWSLYVMDDAAPDAGSIGSWLISIQTTAPTISQIASPVVLNEDVSTNITFQVNAPGIDPTNLVVNATIEGTPIVSLVITGTGTDRTLTINPRSSQIGTNVVTLTVSDSTGSNTNTASTTFTVIVRNVDNDAPVIQPIARQTVRPGDTVVVPVNVNDPDNPLSQLTYFAASSGTNVTDIRFSVTNNALFASITVSPSARAGVETVTISVSDGENVSRTSFELEVLSDNDAPVIGSIADVSTAEDVGVTVRLNITDEETPLEQLTITGRASNTGLVSNVSISTAGGAASAVISLVTNAFGISDITISANDGTNTTERTFRLTVVEVPECPSLPAIANQSGTAGGTITIPLNATDPDTAAGDLTYFSSVVGTDVVQSITFNNGVATIILQGDATGTERVTISVSDGECVVRQSFDITVGGIVGEPATLSVARSGTNSITLTITGTPGANYVIEGTADFRSWTAVGSVTIPAGRSTQITIPATARYQFFRARTGTAGTTPAQAAVYEGYGYSAGTFISTNENGGTGFTASWTPDGETPTNHVVLARGLEYGDGTGRSLITTPGSVLYTANSVTNGDVRSFRNFGPRTNGTTWISFIAQRMGPTVTNAATPNNLYPRAANLSFYEGDTERFAIGNGSGAVSNLWSILPGGSVANVTNAQRSAVPMNQQAFIVLRVDHIGDAAAANDTLHMWVNPPLGATPSTATASASSVGAFNYSFNRIRPFVGGVDTANNRPYAELGLDEFRVGDTFASVAPFESDVTQPFNPIVLVNGTNDTDTAAGAPPANEGVIRVIDNAGQKYLNFLDFNSGFIVSPLGSTVVSGIRFWNANDAPERDPASYVLEGSTAGPDGPWTVISQGPLALTAARNAGGATTPLIGGNLQIVHFANTTPYTSYRVTFPTLKDAATANSMQIAEVDLIGTFE